ncbi:MAG: hypothetical protein ACMXYK_01310 [Candidatus Woesearchaeota archaeon]
MIDFSSSDPRKLYRYFHRGKDSPEHSLERINTVRIDKHELHPDIIEKKRLLLLESIHAIREQIKTIKSAKDRQKLRERLRKIEKSISNK